MAQPQQACFISNVPIFPDLFSHPHFPWPELPIVFDLSRDKETEKDIENKGAAYLRDYSKLYGQGTQLGGIAQ